MNREIKIQCLVYSRVSGYYNPVTNWNKGKQEEFKDRKNMSLSDIFKWGLNEQ